MRGFCATNLLFLYQRVLLLVLGSLLKQCDVIDCNPPSDVCHKTNLVKLGREWIDCGRQECTVDQSTIFSNTLPDPNWCTNINDQTVLDIVFPRMVLMLKYSEAAGGMNKKTQNQMTLVVERMQKYFNESITNNLGTCAASTDEDKMSAKVTCDIKIQTYTRTVSVKQFNSTLMMSLLFAIFSCSILLLGNYESFHFHFSAVRVGSCIVGLLMSSLVYIGSLHLYWSSRNNPLQSDADVQMTWRAFYLIVSYMCLHFGLLVIVPAAEVAVDEKKKNGSDSSATDHQAASPSRCLNILYSVKAIKEQFWDASGK